MPRRPRHRPGPAPTTSARRLAVGVTVLTALTATGCADRSTTGSDQSPSPSATSASSPATDAGTPTSSTDPASPTTQTSSPTSQPTTPSPSMVATTTPTSTGTSAPKTTASPRGPGALRSRLLTAREVPGFNAEFRWKDGRTRNGEAAKPFGTCQRFPMSSIGAVRTVVRTYRPGPRQSHDVAGELVSSFPDEMTARRAFEVLKSWRARCAERLRGRERPRVGRLHDVPLDAGTGAWYLLTYGPVANDPDAVWFDAQGIALVGSRIAVVKLAVASQDYNYEPGQEPMVAAVQRAAAKLS